METSTGVLTPLTDTVDKTLSQVDSVVAQVGEALDPVVPVVRSLRRCLNGSPDDRRKILPSRAS